MAYTKKVWTDDLTNLSAENLNNLEDGLAEASVKVEEASAAVLQHAENLTGLNESLEKLTTDFDKVSSDSSVMQQQIEDNTFALGGHAEALEGQKQWRQEIEILFDGLSTEIDENHAAALEHAHDKGNPHNITPDQIGAYTCQEVDDKLSPVTTVSNVGTNFIDVMCPSIGQFAHNIRLELKSHDEFAGGALWEISAGEAHKTGIYDFISLYTDTILGSAGYTWQQLDSGIEGMVTLSNSDLRNLSAVPVACITSSFGVTALFSDTPNLVIDLVNDKLKKHYFIPIGAENNLRLVVNDDRLFIRRGTFRDKYVIELPQGTKINTILLENGTYSSGCYGSYYVATLQKYTFTLSDNDGTVASSDVIFQEGSYLLPYKPTQETQRDDFIVSGHLLGSATDIEIEYKLSYFRNDTNLHEILNLSSDLTSAEKEQTTFDVKKEFESLITVGVADPDITTPGVLYFKYLP